MADEVLRNGVPHNVTTSLVTHNAVLPQNIFIKDDAPALRDAGMGDVVPSLVQRDPSDSVAKTPIQPTVTPEVSYPVTQDKLVDNDSLTTIKSHIRDNIQALKNLAQSDNMQPLGDSRSIQENKVYLEKKSIKSNRQLVAKTTVARAAPQLNTPNASSASGSDSEGRDSQSTEFQNAETPFTDPDRLNQESALEMRIKKLKGHVRKVDNTLQNLEPDK